MTLAGWAFNLDGVLSDIPLGDALPSAVDASLFDASIGLGTVTVTVGGAGTHFIGLFVDHEIAQQMGGFAPEFGADHGVLAAGQSWEIDEPGFALHFGDIFDNLMAGLLDNSNAVPSTAPNDVAMALAWDVLLGPGEVARITFILSDTSDMAVPAGFVLTQTDAAPNSQVTIAFASTLSIQPVPEPGAWLLLGSGLVGILACRRRWQQSVL